MNILAIYKSLDVVGYYMLGELSQREDITVYIAIESDKDRAKIRGNCIPLNISPIKSKFSRAAIKDLRKITEQYSIDVAYAISTSALSNLIFACKKNKKIKIIGYSGTDTKINRLDLTYYLGWLNPRVDAIICNTPHIKKILEKKVNPAMLTVIQKPYDVAWVEDAFRNPKQIEGIPDDAFKVINIATSKNRPTKGMKYIVEAANILNDPSIHFILVGEYDEKAYALAQKSPVRDRIHFIGRRNDAIYLLPKQDVFVSSSLRDAWPRVVREAMACGLPCVVTDINGPREMVLDKQTGLIVKPGSGQAIADAIRWLKEHEVERKEYGRRSRERIINDFPTAPYIEAYDKFFREIFKS